MRSKDDRKVIKLNYQSNNQNQDQQANLSTVQNLLTSLSPISGYQNMEAFKSISKEAIIHPSTYNRKKQISRERPNEIPTYSLIPSIRKKVFKEEQSSYEKEVLTTLNHLKMKEKLLRSNRKRKYQHMETKIQKTRIEQICNNFKLKLYRNNPYRQPLKERQLQKFEKKTVNSGIKLPSCLQIYTDILSILINLSFVILVSLLLSFTDDEDNDRETKCFIVYGVYFICQILFNFIFTVKSNKSAEESLKESAFTYFMGKFRNDIVMVLVISLKLITQQDISCDILILLAMLLKIPDFRKKINRVQKRIVTNIAYQKYASIIKIICFNFAFAHFVAVVLSLMTHIDTHNNWQITKGIQNKWWVERYVWSYYWATTIMLTIGFGDMVPTTYQQAICVVFIEIISCIAFSYNISCLGSIISTLQQKEQKVENNRKIFNFIASKNHFSKPLIEKIETFIEDEAELKQKFHIDQQNAFISNLPQGYKQQLICQSNISTLKCLPFFGELIKKSIYRLSEHMVKHICTPQEIIRSPNSPFAINILQRGSITYFCNQKGRKFRGININSVTRSDRQKPFLMDLEIVTLRHHKYSIKSLVYSIVHKLHLDDFIRILKGIPKDYEYYCFLRDQSKHKVDEYETVQCKQCGSKHTYFDCPRYHFMPLKSTIVSRHLHNLKIEKNHRQQFSSRRPRISHVPLKLVSTSNIPQKESFHNQNEQIDNRRFQSADINPNRIYSELVKNLNYQQKEIQVFDLPQMEKMHLAVLEKLISLTKDESLDSDNDVWLVNVDKAHNFDLYFNKENAQNIAQRYSMRKTIKK